MIVMDDNENQPVAAVMMRSPQGRVLMMRRVDDGTWAFPAGGIKDGETAEQAAWRETFEETGRRLGDVGRLHMRRVKDGIDCSTYVCPVEEEFTPRLNHEHTSWAWLDPISLLSDVSGVAVNAALPPPLMIGFADSQPHPPRGRAKRVKPPEKATDAHRADDAPQAPELDEDRLWEALATLAEALEARGDADWEEGKHPRGQPGNPGQFGPGGAQAKSEPETPAKSEPKAEPKEKGGEGEAEAPKPSEAATKEPEAEDPDKLDLPAVEWVHKLIDRHSKNVEERRKHEAKLAQHIQNVDAFFKDKKVRDPITGVAVDAVRETPEIFAEVLFKKGADFLADHVSEVVNKAIVGAVTIAGVGLLGFGAGHLIASAAVGYAVEKTAEFLGITPSNAGKLIHKAVKAVAAKVEDSPISKMMSSLPWQHGDTTPFEGEQFVSSNVQKGTDIPSAEKALNSERHKALLAASHDIDSKLGITDSKDQSAVGAWEDGAEDTVMTVSHGASMAQLKVAAAMKGALANQRAVMVARSNPKGKGLMYQFDVKGDLDTINDGLLSTAIEYHTLVPKDGGATVYIASADGNDRVFSAVREAAEHFNAKVAYHRVDAELVGSNKDDGTDEEQRQDAQERYAGIIKGSGVRGADEVWNGVQLRYRARFRAASIRAEQGGQESGSAAQPDAALAALADAVERLDARFERLRL